MAAPAPKYQPNWIGRAEALVIMLELAGLDLGPAGRWLERAKQDRPPVLAAHADPARDLFRINPLIGDDGVVGFSTRPGRLSGWGRGWDSIEISRALLVAELRKLAKPTKGYQRYPQDTALVSEAVKAIKHRKYANANQAANVLATDKRAQGTSPKQIADRLGRKINKALGN